MIYSIYMAIEDDKQAAIRRLKAMGGADHLETAPFLQMEPKTRPTNQSWPVTQPEPTWDVFHLWPLDFTTGMFDMF